MANYDNIDLQYGYDGDFVLGADGDLKDTSSDALVCIQQEIQTVCNSEPGDWELYPGRGAGLADFIGESNSKTTATLLHDRVKIALVSQNVVSSGDLQVKIIPVHANRVLVILRVNASATPYNSLKDGELLVTQLLFDYREQGVMFYEKTPEL